MTMLDFLPKKSAALCQLNSHPGLQLDRFSVAKDQEDQKRVLQRVVELNRDFPDKNLLQNWKKMRSQFLCTALAESFEAVTASALTLHLSRASALENSGICLHPVYGFVYLPGSGLKGMARSYAETVWCPDQKNPREAWRHIDKVFGRAPDSDRHKTWKPAGGESCGDDEKNTAGTIVFHDAWPVTWPELEVDIVNNHHPRYYANEEDPGDWEKPVMVYFLAVPADTRFTFYLTSRVGRKNGDDLLLAKEWLLGALCRMGAGAKTNASYGSFHAPGNEMSGLPISSREEFQAEIELVTPGFFAGAAQSKEDCKLRSASLRGLLRWWWRKLHNSYLDRAKLLELESEIWGSSACGGAIKISVEPKTLAQPVEYNFKNGNMPRADFKRSNSLIDSQKRKSTQGLFYLSYGMDDSNRRRTYVPPGSRWTVSLSSRGISRQGQYLSAIQVLRQAKSAVYLLCNHGGVGSKARKGFGSLQADIDGFTLETCIEFASDFRKSWGQAGKARMPKQPSSLETALQLEVVTPWTNYWFALDQLGFAVQRFAQDRSHQLEKKALGLPRKIGSPVRGSFSAAGIDRHASPAHFHFSRGIDGKLTIRMIAFPSPRLPDFDTSQNFLTGYRAALKLDLEKRCQVFRTRGNLPVYPASSVEPERNASSTPVSVLQPPTIRANKETWTSATLTWIPGSKILTAVNCLEKNKRAIAQGTAALGLVPQAFHGKLINKKKAVQAMVEVEAMGNKYVIISIKQQQ